VRSDQPRSSEAVDEVAPGQRLPTTPLWPRRRLNGFFAGPRSSRSTRGRTRPAPRDAAIASTRGTPSGDARLSPVVTTRSGASSPATGGTPAYAVGRPTMCTSLTCRSAQRRSGRRQQWDVVARSTNAWRSMPDALPEAGRAEPRDGERDGTAGARPMIRTTSEQRRAASAPAPPDEPGTGTRAALPPRCRHSRRAPAARRVRLGSSAARTSGFGVGPGSGSVRRR